MIQHTLNGNLVRYTKKQMALDYARRRFAIARQAYWFAQYYAQNTLPERAREMYIAQKKLETQERRSTK